MQRLIERLRTGRMFSMTGAGLSAWAGYPVWSVLLRRLEQRVQELRDGEVDVALIRRRLGQSPLELAEHAWPEAVTLTFRLEDAFR